MLEIKLINRILFKGIIIFCFLLLVGRLVQLQIINSDLYQVLSEGNTIRLVSIPAPRGLIYDRNGEVLVTSRFAYRVSIMPPVHNIQEDIFEKLGAILFMDPDDIRYRVQNASGFPYEPIVIKTDVSTDMVISIEERKMELSGVMIDRVPVREYNYNNPAAHIVGRIGRISEDQLRTLRSEGYTSTDIVGITGIERYYESDLRGINGVRRIEVDARLNPVSPVRYLEDIELTTDHERSPVSGADIVLTIDLELQMAVENLLKEGINEARERYPSTSGGTAILLRPETGEILAMASYPDYDPNLFVGGISTSDWNALINDPDRPFVNRATSAYAPGSVFKPVVAIAGLETDLVDGGENILCTGVDLVLPDEKRCWIWYSTGRGHGDVTMAEALGVSCNVFFYELGRRIGIDDLSDWSFRFGLGQSTGITLFPADSQGLVPTREWKLEARGQRWLAPTETMDMSIGQGFLNTTPLQIAGVYAGIATGGDIYKPYLVKEIRGPDRNIIFQSEPELLKPSLHLSLDTIDIINQGLTQTVTDGTASLTFNGFPISLAGKTGSAEVGGGKSHAWFGGYAPADNPEVVVVVFLELGGTGAGSAAPIARAILETYFNIETTETERVIRLE